MKLIEHLEQTSPSTRLILIGAVGYVALMGLFTLNDKISDLANPYFSPIGEYRLAGNEQEVKQIDVHGLPMIVTESALKQHSNEFNEQTVYKAFVPPPPPPKVVEVPKTAPVEVSYQDPITKMFAKATVGGVMNNGAFVDGRFVTVGEQMTRYSYFSSETKKMITPVLKSINGQAVTISGYKDSVVLHAK